MSATTGALDRSVAVGYTRAVLVRGVELAVRDLGGATAPAAAFVWGHGLTSSMEQEDRNGVFDWSAAATAAGTRLIRFDARGHGASADADDDYRWPSLASDLLGVLDGLGLQRAVVGGASMGAATAIHAAVQAPERVTALVLVIPPTAWASRAAQARLYRVAARTVQTIGIGPVVRAASLAPKPAIFRDELASLADDAVEAWRDFDRGTLAAILRGAAASDLPKAGDVATIRAPALILAWDTDSGHPVSTAERLAELLPASELHVARQPAEVVAWGQYVEAFLRSCLPS